MEALEHLHGAEWQVGEDSWITAQLGLQDAAGMATSAFLTPSVLSAKVEGRGSVPVTVSLHDGVLHEVVLAGYDFVLALRAVDVPITEEAMLELESRDVRLTFGGPTQPVRRPDPSRVGDGVHRLPGCPPPQQESA